MKPTKIYINVCNMAIFFCLCSRRHLMTHSIFLHSSVHFLAFVNLHFGNMSSFLIRSINNLTSIRTTFPQEWSELSSLMLANICVKACSGKVFHEVFLQFRRILKDSKSFLAFCRSFTIIAGYFRFLLTIFFRFQMIFDC